MIVLVHNSDGISLPTTNISHPAEYNININVHQQRRYISTNDDHINHQHHSSSWIQQQHQRTPTATVYLYQRRPYQPPTSLIQLNTTTTSTYTNIDGISLPTTTISTTNITHPAEYNNNINVHQQRRYISTNDDHINHQHHSSSWIQQQHQRTPTATVYLYQRRPYQPPTSLIQLNTTTTSTYTNSDGISLPTTTISTTNITHPAEYNNNELTSLFVTATNKLSYFLYCYLAFVSFNCSFWLSLLLRLTKTICRVDVLIGSATVSSN